MDSDRLILWVVFNLFVLGMLALDLGVFHRKAHAVSMRESSTWTIVWVALAMSFNVGIYFIWGQDKALEFLTGYVIEKSLSVDNLFVFLMIFQYFNTPAEYQHRILFWGIIGALILRAIFIATGAALITNFHWMIYVFGGFLVITGIKMLLQGDEKLEPDNNPLVRLFQKFMPVSHQYHGQNFFITVNGKTQATLMMVVLIVVETTDVIFAVDSIPAIFAITTDPFIVYTSNVFAILGLRALYFMLAGVMAMFVYLKVGLSFILCFVGIKMLFVDLYKIPIGLSLAVICGILVLSVIASLAVRGRAKVPVDGATALRGVGLSAGGATAATIVMWLAAFFAAKYTTTANWTSVLPGPDRESAAQERTVSEAIGQVEETLRLSRLKLEEKSFDESLAWAQESVRLLADLKNNPPR